MRLLTLEEGWVCNKWVVTFDPHTDIIECWYQPQFYESTDFCHPQILDWRLQHHFPFLTLPSPDFAEKVIPVALNQEINIFQEHYWPTLLTISVLKNIFSFLFVDLVDKYHIDLSMPWDKTILITVHEMCWHNEVIHRYMCAYITIYWPQKTDVIFLLTDHRWYMSSTYLWRR